MSSSDIDPVLIEPWHGVVYSLYIARQWPKFTAITNFFHLPERLDNQRERATDASQRRARQNNGMDAAREQKGEEEDELCKV
jgi:hypothetical protein